MVKELDAKMLIAKDDEYFDIIPNIEEVAKSPDALNKILKLFEIEAKKIINSEEYNKMAPEIVQGFKKINLKPRKNSRINLKLQIKTLKIFSHQYAWHR